MRLSLSLTRVCRFPTGQQLVTKLVTAPMGTVMVPTTMIMGQVVTAYNPFTQQQGQPQAITLQQQPAAQTVQAVQAQADSQTQAAQGQTTQQGVAQQAQQQQQAQFLQVQLLRLSTEEGS